MRRACDPPCRRRVQAEYISTVAGDMPKQLSRAQTRAAELSLNLTAFTPQEDGTLHYVVECDER